MGWLIVGVGEASAASEASLKETPEDRSVVISRIGHNSEVIDEFSAILPVPDFAKSIELTIDRYPVLVGKNFTQSKISWQSSGIPRTQILPLGLKHSPSQCSGDSIAH
jgi:hypothetical protein